MISQTVEYALRAAVSLAHWHGQLRTAGQLAADTQVSSAYLSKIMVGLVRAGLVNSQRGPGGGFSLARDPSETTVWAVVEAVEPSRRIHTCPLGIASHGRNLCPLHRQLDETMAAAEESLRSRRLSDLLGEQGGVQPLCDHPAA
jgi:Rrf2 family protein